MNTTKSVNISGDVFTINDDAFLLLERYLDKLEATRNVNMEDIEAKLSRIFIDMGASSVRVVTIANVREAIGILNVPFGENEWSGCNSNEPLRRKLIRDPNDKAVAGICVAVANYAALDVTIIRVIFVLATLFGASGLLVYIVLMIVIPKATTPEDFEVIRRMKNGTL